jgi:beta-phosphoglucomutase-like phosphatase (HAD superfamily)
MSKKEDEAFAAWTEELAKKVTTEEADAFKVWAKTDAAREVFRGTIGQAELYRRMNEIDREKKEVASQREQLEEWYEEQSPKNEELIKERDELRAQLAELGLAGPPPAVATPGPSISAEELAELKAKGDKMEALDKLLPAVLGDISMVLRDSIKNDFDIDPREVIKFSLQNSIEPYRAYEILTADERQKREEKHQEDERKKWYEEGRRAALTTNSPDHLQPSGPSVVDYLQGLNKQAGAAGTSPANERSDRIAAAMKEFIEGGVS